MKYKQWLFGGEDFQSVTANTGLLLLRIYTGLSLALAHGIHKTPPSEGFIAGVEKLGFPAPDFFAWAAGLSEFAGGILLALGLLTRPSAFFICFTMSVAAFIRHSADPFGAKEKALLFAMIALFFLLTGAGKFAIDAVIRRRIGK